MVKHTLRKVKRKTATLKRSKPFGKNKKIINTKKNKFVKQNKTVKKNKTLKTQIKAKKQIKTLKGGDNLPETFDMFILPEINNNNKYNYYTSDKFNYYLTEILAFLNKYNNNNNLSLNELFTSINCEKFKDRNTNNNNSINQLNNILQNILELIVNDNIDINILKLILYQLENINLFDFNVVKRTNVTERITKHKQIIKAKIKKYNKNQINNSEYTYQTLEYDYLTKHIYNNENFKNIIKNLDILKFISDLYKFIINTKTLTDCIKDIFNILYKILFHIKFNEDIMKTLKFNTIELEANKNENETFTSNNNKYSLNNPLPSKSNTNLIYINSNNETKKFMLKVLEVLFKNYKKILKTKHDNTQVIKEAQQYAKEQKVTTNPNPGYELVEPKPTPTQTTSSEKKSFFSRLFRRRNK